MRRINQILNRSHSSRHKKGPCHERTGHKFQAQDRQRTYTIDAAVKCCNDWPHSIETRDSHLLNQRYTNLSKYQSAKSRRSGVV
jgi:hypothetical protein